MREASNQGRHINQHVISKQYILLFFLEILRKARAGWCGASLLKTSQIQLPKSSKAYSHEFSLKILIRLK